MLNEKGAELLKRVIQNKYKDISLDSLYADDNEFYYEFKIHEVISENDFGNLEEEIQKSEAPDAQAVPDEAQQQAVPAPVPAADAADASAQPASAPAAATAPAGK